MHVKHMRKFNGIPRDHFTLLSGTAPQIIMKINRGLFCLITTLSMCVGQGDDSTFSNAAILRTGMRFAVEVLFNNIALNTVPDGVTTRQSIAHILKQKGIVGFYSGAPIEVLRSALWYPRMQLMNEPWKVGVPVGALKSSLDFVEYDKSVSIAVNLAAFEMAVMPLFRVRNAWMLHSFQNILDKATHISETLYAGSVLRGGITFISWYSFFKAQEYAKEHWESRSLSQAAFTTGTQMLVGGVTAPLYVVMINRQKLTNPCSLPFLESVRETYLKQGAHVFARSAKFGAAHAGVQAVLTVGVLKLCTEN